MVVVMADVWMGLVVLLLGVLLEGRGALRNCAGIRDMRCCRLWVPAAPSVAVLLSIWRACVKPAH